MRYFAKNYVKKVMVDQYYHQYQGCTMAAAIRPLASSEVLAPMELLDRVELLAPMKLLDRVELLVPMKLLDPTGTSSFGHLFVWLSVSTELSPPDVAGWIAAKNCDLVAIVYGLVLFAQAWKAGSFRSR
jgi:hypothetical protein